MLLQLIFILPNDIQVEVDGHGIQVLPVGIIM